MQNVGKCVFGVPYEIGTKVHIDKEKSIKATVVAWRIWGTYSDAYVSWFVHGEAKSDWFDSWRLSATED